MKNLTRYDDTNPESILQFAKKLVGMTFQDIVLDYEIESHKYNEDFIVEDDDLLARFRNPNAKGELGTILEKYYFRYPQNSQQEADFPNAGIELKQTCVDKKKNGDFTAGERLSITNISYLDPVEENFNDSHVFKKINKILLIHYLREKALNRMDYRILFVNMFTPPEEDMKIIIDDYNYIINKIKEGKAHELSEGDTMYLGACTKGATAKSSERPQYYNKEIKAKKRNFCFKRSYMDYVLKNYIMKNPTTGIESIMPSKSTFTLDEIIISKIAEYQGIYVDDLCSLFNIPNQSKQIISKLVHHMLGTKSNQASELVKAGIKIKTIRLDENNQMKECMSFDTFKYKELASETWESSDANILFAENKFLFVVFKKYEKGYKLIGSQLWNMPDHDLQTVEIEWKKAQEIIKSGIKFNIVVQRNREIVKNNLPGIKDTEIFHLRTKSSKSAYRLNNGYTRNLKKLKANANELPNGEWAANMCYWLNSSYILKQLHFSLFQK